MSDTNTNILQVGQKLPDFSLYNAHEEFRSLADVRGEKGTVIAFVHGAFCPSCMPQLQRLNQLVPVLKSKGINLVCVSHDSISTILAFQLSTEPALEYTMLQDSTPTLAKAYGIEHEFYGSPYASIFLADANDIIAYADTSPDPLCNPDREAMMKIVEAW